MSLLSELKELDAFHCIVLIILSIIAAAVITVGIIRFSGPLNNPQIQSGVVATPTVAPTPCKCGKDVSDDKSARGNSVGKKAE